MNTTRALPWRERLGRLRGTALAAGGLLVLALITQGLLWLRREPDADAAFVGPPRSDYVLLDFELIAHGEDGRRDFRVVSPRLVKHPALDTLDLEQPRFSLDDERGDRWNARALRGWIDPGADRLRLEGEVVVARAATAQRGAATVETERLEADVNTRIVRSDRAVTIRQPGSILRGTGLHADLDQDRFILEKDVKARYDRSLSP